MTYRARLQMDRETFRSIHRTLRENPRPHVFGYYRFSARVDGGLSFVSFDTRDTVGILNTAAKLRREGDKAASRRCTQFAREIREINAGCLA